MSHRIRVLRFPEVVKFDRLKPENWFDHFEENIKNFKISTENLMIDYLSSNIDDENF